MQVLQVILYIILFIFCLAVLILVHEAGHLATAKIFKVYCLDFSIGFGPAFFRRKRKNGETYFSLRAIPFGGYVSMYGEGSVVPDGLTIDDSRSLEGIKKWKKCIILLAGVTMNAILALVLFFVSESCFQKTDYFVNQVVLKSGGIVETAGLTEDDKFDVDPYNNVYVIDENAIAHFNDSSTVQTNVAFQRAISSSKELSWNTFIHFYKTSELSYVYKCDKCHKECEAGSHLGTDFVCPNPKCGADYTHFGLGTLSYNPDQPNVEITANLNNLVKVDFTLKVFDADATEEKPTTHDVVISVPVVTKEGKRAFEDYGASLYTEKYWQSFGSSLKYTFVDFGNSSTAIVRGLASLIKPSQWKNVSGLVGIGFETASIISNFGLGTFLYVWGLISVNLAIINLVPFPGLDGWQLLVTIIEGISRKKMNEKVKNIVSIIGIAILFLLMILIVFKDVFTYIF